MSENERILLDFIRLELLEDPNYELTSADELLLDDIVDSLGVMRLVEFIEDRGSTTIPAEDITIDNFASVGVISRYIENRKVTLT